VLFQRTDLSDPQAVASSLGKLAAELPPLGGVIHAAGVLDDAAVLSQSLEKIERVLRPKALGAWTLHKHTEHQKLDFFVEFSSESSLLGWYGQANYASANAFLDGLAHYRTRRGLPGLSINWGPWDAGMAARLGEAELRRLEKMGVQRLSTPMALRLMPSLLASPGQIGVLGMQWARYARGIRKDRRSTF